MSCVFLAGGRVYKLKKPVRFPYLDFSTLERREAACRAEVSLNRRLAPGVYIGVAPLAVSAGGLSIGGAGAVTDWLVVMHRLDDRWALEQVLRERRLDKPQLDRLVARLVRFYRRARLVFISPGAHLAQWSENLAANRRVLLDPRFGLPSAPIRRIDRLQRRFLAEGRAVLAGRVRRRRMVDGHGDLRPEHIWLDHEVRIIDCLEFNPRLRAVDPFDEIAYLDLECERLGAAWAGHYIRKGVERGLGDDLPAGLYRFYRSYRAALRARLAMPISPRRSRARPRNGPASRAPTSKSPPRTRRASRPPSEHDEVGEGAAVVKARDRLGQKRSSGEDLELAPVSLLRQPERRHAVGYDEPFDGGVGQDLCRAWHEEAMRHQGHDPPGAGLAGGPCRAQERAAGADQIVNDKGRAVRHVAHEQVTGDHPGAAMLVRKCPADGAAARGLQRLAQELGALGAAGVGRDDAEIWLKLGSRLAQMVPCGVVPCFSRFG
jgi:aminoglycoside phosphotransferase family enzyme